jgi:hypothetical protein
VFTDYTEQPTLQPSSCPPRFQADVVAAVLESLFPVDWQHLRMQVTLVQSEFCRTYWVLLLHGLVETRLDGSTGPYGLLSYCSLHGLSRVQPSLWHCLTTSTTAHQPVILQSAHSPGWFTTQALHFGHKLQFTIMVSSSPNSR